MGLPWGYGSSKGVMWLGLSEEASWQGGTGSTTGRVGEETALFVLPNIPIADMAHLTPCL